MNKCDTIITDENVTFQYDDQDSIAMPTHVSSEIVRAINNPIHPYVNARIPLVEPPVGYFTVADVRYAWTGGNYLKKVEPDGFLSLEYYSLPDEFSILADGLPVISKNYPELKRQYERKLYPSGGK